METLATDEWRRHRSLMSAVTCLFFAFNSKSRSSRLEVLPFGDSSEDRSRRHACNACLRQPPETQDEEAFEGDAGRPRLLDALLKQDVVQHEPALAAALAEGGELVQFEPGANVVIQDATDNSVYVLLSGESNVFVHNRFVGVRTDGTCIGEMAAIDPAARRFATVRAKTIVVAPGGADIAV